MQASFDISQLFILIKLIANDFLPYTRVWGRLVGGSPTGAIHFLSGESIPICQPAYRTFQHEHPVIIQNTLLAAWAKRTCLKSACKFFPLLVRYFW